MNAKQQQMGAVTGSADTARILLSHVQNLIKTKKEQVELLSRY